MSVAEALAASRCPGCGLVAAPPEPYGCESCGTPAAELERVEVEAAGTVRSHATVHRHHKPEPSTPFTVVLVALDAGPALKGVLHGDRVAIGDRVSGAVTDGLLRFEVV
jgi:uncharacterized OB-fold protein